jgi:hypothetical protein
LDLFMLVINELSTELSITGIVKFKFW